MKKYLLLAFSLLMLSARLPAQSGVSGNLTADSTDCTKTNACLEVDIPQNVGGATIKLSGTYNTVTQFEVSADPLTVPVASAKWVALSAAASDGSGTATSSTASGSGQSFAWQANVTGFRRIRLRVSTFTSGTVAAAINLSTASARVGGPSGGGGTISGSISAGDTAYGSATNTIAGGTVVLDMAGIAGADLGAKMNNCAAQLPAAGGACSGANLANAQTLSTAVTITKPISFQFCGQSITQTAAISFSTGSAHSSLIGCSDQATTFTKGANLDQVAVSDAYVEIANLTFNGSRSSPRTGSGIVGATGSTHMDVHDNTIVSESTDALQIGDATSTARNNEISDFGASGIDMTSSAANAQELFTNNRITGATDSTGSDIITSGDDQGMTVANNLFYIQSTASWCINDATSDFPPPNVTGNKCFYLGHSAGGFFLPSGIIVGNDVSTVSPVDFSFNTTDNPLIVTNQGSEITGNLLRAAGTPPLLDGQWCLLIEPINSLVPSIVTVTGNTFQNCAGGQEAGIEIKDGGVAQSGIGEITISGNYMRTGESDGTHDVQGVLLSLTAASTLAPISIDGNVLYDLITPDTHHIAIQVVNSGGGTVGTALAITNNTIGNYDRGILATAANVGAANFRGNNFNGTTTPYAGTLAPAVASGFGTGAAVTTNTDGSAILIGVGTSNTGTGVLRLPAAAHGWACTATDTTTTSTTVSTTKVVPTSTTSVTFQNYTDISGTHAWVDSDVLSANCAPY